MIELNHAALVVSGVLTYYESTECTKRHLNDLPEASKLESVGC